MINQIIKSEDTWEQIDTFTFQFGNVVLNEEYEYLIPKKYKENTLNILLDVNEGFIELGFFENKKLITYFHYDISTLKFIKRKSND